MAPIVIRTNNHPRPIVYDFELTGAERAKFDYLDWTREGDDWVADGGAFVRYRGELYDLHEFEATSALGAPAEFARWDGYQSDSFYSGLLVRYVDDLERVIVATYCA